MSTSVNDLNRATTVKQGEKNKESTASLAMDSTSTTTSTEFGSSKTSDLDTKTSSNSNTSMNNITVNVRTPKRTERKSLDNKQLAAREQPQVDLAHSVPVSAEFYSAIRAQTTPPPRRERITNSITEDKTISPINSSPVYQQSFPSGSSPHSPLATVTRANGKASKNTVPPNATLPSAAVNTLPIKPRTSHDNSSSRPQMPILSNIPNNQMEPQGSAAKIPKLMPVHNAPNTMSDFERLQLSEFRRSAPSHEQLKPNVKKSFIPTNTPAPPSSAVATDIPPHAPVVRQNPFDTPSTYQSKKKSSSTSNLQNTNAPFPENIQFNLRMDGTSNSETETSLSKGSTANSSAFNANNSSLNENGRMKARIVRNASFGRFIISPLQKTGQNIRNKFDRSNNPAMDEYDFDDAPTIDSTDGDHRSRRKPKDNLTTTSINDSVCSRNSSSTLHKPLLFGYLYKLGRNGNWQRRWFETDGKSLAYFKNKKRVKLLATLDLQKVGLIFLDSTDPLGNTFCIQVAHRHYHLCSDTSEGARDWVISLNRIKEARLQIGNLKLVETSDLLLNEGLSGDTNDSWNKENEAKVVMMALRPRTRNIEKIEDLDPAEQNIMDIINTENKENHEMPLPNASKDDTHKDSNDNESLGKQFSQDVFLPEDPRILGKHSIYVKNQAFPPPMPARWKKKRSRIQNVTRRLSRWAKRVTKIRCIVKDDVVHLGKKRHRENLEHKDKDESNSSAEKQPQRKETSSYRNMDKTVNKEGGHNKGKRHSEGGAFNPRRNRAGYKVDDSFVDMDIDPITGQVRNVYTQYPGAIDENDEATLRRENPNSKSQPRDDFDINRQRSNDSKKRVIPGDSSIGGGSIHSGSRGGDSSAERSSSVKYDDGSDSGVIA
eukprot:CAMPEP_0184858942 /NCGR_PEP_ID=MMETSP0580-20130426/3966_1 /TAXON_ID=1118495 /ORGANISM="Dactyliosolen fragilissimus" /LENGTH=883 /DNA_ID=CAMNT_0027355311 /DNA_START=340 /DNA_END=2991 /DNA_ORIENTATION=+